MFLTDLRRRGGDVWQSVRRSVLGRRRLLSALCAALAVFAGLRAAAPPPPDTVTVLAAARDLPSGTVLGAADLTPVEFDPETVPDGASSRSAAIGRTVAAPLRRGEPVTDVRLVGESLLDGYPGMAAVPVRIPDPGAVELLKVGDRIDVLVADPRGEEEAQAAITDAPVVAIPEAESLAGAGGLPGRLIVIAATPYAAQNLAAASVTGYLSVMISR